MHTVGRVIAGLAEVRDNEVGESDGKGMEKEPGEKVEGERDGWVHGVSGWFADFEQEDVCDEHGDRGSDTEPENADGDDVYA